MWPFLSQAEPLSDPALWEQFGPFGIVCLLMAAAIIVLARKLTASETRERELYDRIAAQSERFAPLIERLVRELDRMEHTP